MMSFTQVNRVVNRGFKASVLGSAVLALSFLATPGWAATLGANCESCSPAQRLQLAQQTGLRFSGDFGSGIVFVSDFPNALIEKFYVFKENAQYSQKDNSLPLADAAALYDFRVDDVIKTHDPFQSGSVSVTAVQLQLSAVEARQAETVIQFVNEVLRPAGGGQPLASLQATDGAMGARIMVHSIGRLSVPSSIATSAHELMGMDRLALDLGAMMKNMHPVLLDGGENGVTKDSALPLPINTTFAVTFEFSDGSIGDWFIDQRGELRADFRTFEDSERNPIPWLDSDPNGRGYLFGGGRESSNFQNMLKRFQVLGIDVNDRGGGGGSCRFSCNSDACTVTCSLN